MPEPTNSFLLQLNTIGSMRLALFLLTLLAAAPLSSTDTGADAIVGLWRTQPTDERYAHVEMKRYGDVYSGAIVWLSEPNFPPGDPDEGEPKVDRMNPDPALRGRPLLGLHLVSGFRYAGNGLWEDGVIYDPESGSTYQCKAELTADGQLEVRGFVGFSFFGRTTVWTRAVAKDR